MQAERLDRAATIAVMVLGGVLCAAQVDHRRGLIDMDEVAWISSGRYLDLLLAGDVDNPDWWAFDSYAHHPPVGSYVVGAVLHAIGEPMTSMEPRRYWYEHDIDGFFDADTLRASLNARVTQRQLMAMRWVAALLTWATAVGAALVARRVAGWWAACATMTLLVLHPTFMVLGQLGQIDALMTFASVAAYGAALGLARSTSTRHAAGWSVALCAAFTLAFGLKISGAFLVVPAVAIVVTAGAHRRAAAGLVVAAALAAGATIALDPALFHHPIDQTIARLDWRLDRVSIQQLIFVENRLDGFGHRIAWSSWLLLLGTPAAMTLTFMCIVGVVGGASREQWALVVVAVLSAFMAMASVPLAWPRYIAVALPALAIVAGIGVAHLRALHKIGQRRRLLVELASSMAVVVIARFALATSHAPRPPTDVDLRIKGMMIHALRRPGEDPRLHALLLEHFERIGDERRARAERAILAAHPPVDAPAR